jgi:hypothetical protein
MPNAIILLLDEDNEEKPFDISWSPSAIEYRGIYWEEDFLKFI